MDITRYVRVNRQSPVPLTTQLAQQLTLLIAGGTLPPGGELPPVRDLAAVLGINLHTVRAAYRRLDEEGLIDMGRGRRTRVLAYDGRRAPAGPGVPSYSVGVILPAYSPFYAPFIDGIEFGSDDPSLLFLCNVRDDPDRALIYMNQLVARSVDGIICASPFLSIESHLPEQPVVFADWPDAPGPRVNFNHELSGYLATTHLIEHGHRRIGLVIPPPSWSNVAPRLAGYRRALANAGIEFASELVAESVGFEAEHATAPVQHLLGLPDVPSAVFAVSDTLAMGVLKELADNGRRIPEDVALVSADGLAASGLTSPPLTTVELPAYRLGAEARSMMEILKAGEQPPSTDVVLPVDLVVRESCGPHS